MRSLNDIFDNDQETDPEDALVTTASEEAYEAAMNSLNEARRVRERQRREMAERYKALRGGEDGEE